MRKIDKVLASIGYYLTIRNPLKGGHMKFLKIIGIVVLVIILVIISSMVIKNNLTPKAIGITAGQFTPLANTPNGVSSQVTDPSKQVQALPFKDNLETTKKHIKAACESYGQVKIITETDTYMHMVFTTGLMKYHDDVELYFDQTNKVIHYKSQSRIGYSDMGLNRKRYDEILMIYEGIK